MPWERSIGEASASKLNIYAKKDGPYDVSWYDQAGKRHAKAEWFSGTEGKTPASVEGEIQKLLDAIVTRTGLRDRAQLGVRATLPTNARILLLLAARRPFHAGKPPR
jgi:hypothetical protein